MDLRHNKLKYRAWHRGFREADLILGPFADAHLADMTPAQLDAFEALLEAPDHDLYGWIVAETEVEPPAEAASEVLGMIRAYRFSAHRAFRT
jgi:antitoxin CptB